MKKVTLADLEHLTVLIPELGVVVQVDDEALRALARKAHDNKRKTAVSGPCKARVTGARPSAFEDVYWVVYQTPRGGGRSSKMTWRDAEKHFNAAVDEATKYNYVYIELRGPTGIHAAWGTKR